jgi:hypothetical protein
LQIADSYRGITGNTTLNEAGYRKNGDYDFWVVKANNANNNARSAFEWKQVGRYKFNANITYGSIK